MFHAKEGPFIERGSGEAVLGPAGQPCTSDLQLQEPCELENELGCQLEVSLEYLVEFYGSDLFDLWGLCPISLIL